VATTVHFPVAPLFIAGDVALDFLNTRMRHGSEEIELLGDDARVLEWLRRAGFAPPGTRAGSRLAPGALAAAAHDLREAGRALVESRKQGKRANPQLLNRYLELGSGYRELQWPNARGPRLVTRRGADTAEQILSPVAEAMAELLSTADFRLVRECESPECVLWFYDLTKSHRRRWCSMSACGNRVKVAAFRERRRKRR
jgi:predicted RNA-binding Zn ribbon-like protein